MSEAETPAATAARWVGTPRARTRAGLSIYSLLLIMLLSVSVLSPITDEMRRLMDDTTHIDGILRDGGERARARAEKTMKEVRDIIGFVR